MSTSNFSAKAPVRPTTKLRALQALLGFVVVAILTGCGADPPPHWADGGAPLEIRPAVWDRGDDDDRIEIRANGEVVEDDDVILVIDRAGRVVDDDREPIAIMLRDGNIAGTDDRYLGRVGMNNASPPSTATAWLSILPDGNVVFFDEDGERTNGGRWTGCNGPQMRTCTLVTHLVTLRARGRDSNSGVGFGVGVGIGIIP